MRAQRMALGLTQEQLALEAGVKRSYISEVEAGKRNASLEFLEKIAGALQVEPSDLIKDGD